MTVELYPLVHEGDDIKRGPNVVPKEFTSPKTTTLRVKIAEGTTSCPPST